MVPAAATATADSSNEQSEKGVQTYNDHLLARHLQEQDNGSDIGIISSLSSSDDDSKDSGDNERRRTLINENDINNLLLNQTKGDRVKENGEANQPRENERQQLILQQIQGIHDEEMTDRHDKNWLNKLKEFLKINGNPDYKWKKWVWNQRWYCNSG